LAHGVDAEVETLRLLAVQRRKASLGLFLKQNVSPDLGSEAGPAEKAKAQALGEPSAGRVRTGNAISRLEGA
jgi:hypothetical protein